MKALTTDTGLNWLGFLVLVYQGVAAMPEGQAKSILTGAVLTVAAVVAFATKGSGLSKEQGIEVLENSKKIEEVLKAGREPANANQPSGD
jgi:hypothetical protein